MADQKKEDVVPQRRPDQPLGPALRLALITISAALYAAAIGLTAPIATPWGLGQFRPGVVFPSVFAIIYGPLVGGAGAAIGLVYGRRSPPEGSGERAYEVSKDFVGRFKTKFGTTICGELLGDLLREATDESEKKRSARCSQYVLNAEKMCAETLLKYEKRYPRI